jgi:hypothetical protein
VDRLAHPQALLRRGRPRRQFSLIRFSGTEDFLQKFKAVVFRLGERLRADPGIR